MIHVEQCIKDIPAALDLNSWKEEWNSEHIKVFSQYNLFDSGVIGFKTISIHALSPESIKNLLSDVSGAMHKMNPLFLWGEDLEKWSSSADKQGKLVRTSFRMPFPMKNREFLHGLHSKQIDNKTFIVAYTPIDRKDIPVQKGFVRCPMYISGQRIQELDNGLVQVEHLMIYELSGKITASIQDNFMLKAHTKAYVEEWTNLGKVLFPSPLIQLDSHQLKTIGLHTLEESTTWPTIHNKPYGKVQKGSSAYCPNTIFRLDFTVDASIETVVQVLADESLSYLPQWNKEFLRGSIVKKITTSEQLDAWLVQVEYKTPNPIANRLYHYYFSREWISPSEVLISYCSVQGEDIASGKNKEEALLYPSYHYCKAVDKNKTNILHLLATDLGGKLSRWQDSLLGNSLAKAQLYDMQKLQELFKQF